MKYEDDEREFSPGERSVIRRLLLALTFQQIDEIKELVTAHKRITWATKTIGLWVKWIFWISAGVVSIKVAFGEYLLRLLK